MGTRIHDLEELAISLRRMEATKRFDPREYRLLARRIMRRLGEANPGRKLEVALMNYPILAELFENIHYGTVGLCRSNQVKATNARLETDKFMRALLRKGARNEP